MAKFKVGDKVRILDGSKIKDYTGGWNKMMGERVGEVHKITQVYEIWGNSPCAAHELDVNEFCRFCKWDERGLKAACKFNVGDKVIGNKKANRYGYTREGWIGTVTEVFNTPMYGYDFRAIGPCGGEDQEFGLEEECFDLIPTDKIVITTDGKTTTAVLYDGKKRIKEAKAVCAPDDEFDFNKGAAIALERLTGQAYGKVENTLEEKSQMDRFIAGEIALRVPKEKIDKFLKECEKRDLRWCSGKKATEYVPDYKVTRMYHDEGHLQEDFFDVEGYTYEDWEKTEEDAPDFIKAMAAIAAFAKFMKDELDD